MAERIKRRSHCQSRVCCNGPCALNWLPLVAQDADQASGDYSIILRDDGQKQWAFRGKPLHLWSKDKKPGDKAGDGFNSVWHIIKLTLNTSSPTDLAIGRIDWQYCFCLSDAADTDEEVF